MANEYLKTQYELEKQIYKGIKNMNYEEWLEQHCLALSKELSKVNTFRKELRDFIK